VPTVIFVDTSFWVALRRHRDERHREAVTLTRAHAGALVTSNHVLGEPWTVLRRREGPAHAVETLDAVTHSRRVAVERIGRGTEREAWRWLALTLDRDFAAAGFRELRA